MWRAIDVATTWAMRLSAGAAVLMTALVTTEVVARNLFRTSTLVADEMSSYLLVILMFFGLAESFRSDTFIRVELLDKFVSSTVRRGLDVAILLVAVGYASVLTYEFWRFAALAYRLGTRSVYFFETRLWIPRVLMAVGMSLLATQLLAALAKRIRLPKEGT